MLIHNTVAQFVDELSSSSPAPGGGSAAALAGALGAALAVMVCRLTENNDKFGSVHAVIGDMREKTLRLKDRLMKCVDEDTAAFNRVMQAYQLPKSSDAEKKARTEAIQHATREAALLPLEVAEACLEIMILSGKVLTIGNPNAASDATVAGLLAYAGLRGAVYNVKINLLSIKDEEFVMIMRTKVAALLQNAERINQMVLAEAERVIG